MKKEPNDKLSEYTKKRAEMLSNFVDRVEKLMDIEDITAKETYEEILRDIEKLELLSKGLRELLKDMYKVSDKQINNYLKDLTNKP
jgi:uncharacterized protein YutE (UPF0331/DUF86 family)